MSESETEKEYVMYNGDNNGPYEDTTFTRDWEGLQKWLGEKLKNLYRERTEFIESHRKEIRLFTEKAFKGLTKEELDFANQFYGWVQQTGKITLIASILQLFSDNEDLLLLVLKVKEELGQIKEMPLDKGF